MTIITLVRPQEIDGDFADLPPEDQRLAASLGGMNQFRMARALGKTLPQPPSTSPPASMSDTEKKKRLAELTLSTGSQGLAKIAMATHAPR